MAQNDPWRDMPKRPEPPGAPPATPMPYVTPGPYPPAPGYPGYGTTYTGRYAGAYPVTAFAGPAHGLPWYLPAARPGPSASLAWASYWSRVGAFLVDIAIVLVTFAGVAIVAGLLDEPGNETTSAASTIVLSLWAIAFFAYWPLMWTAAGATLGQRALSLQVRRADGRTVDASTALVRYAGCWLTVLGVTFATPVALVFLVATVPGESRRQMWHDRMADTVVVRPSWR